MHKEIKNGVFLCLHLNASLDAFLKEPLFDGKTFWECEKEMECVDE